jgi:hypothetical protein
MYIVYTYMFVDTEIIIVISHRMIVTVIQTTIPRRRKQKKPVLNVPGKVVNVNLRIYMYFQRMFASLLVISVQAFLTYYICMSDCDDKHQ